MNDISIKKRSSNLELLRILSMVLIIAHHYSVHGGFNLNDNSIYFNKVIVQILSIGGKLGVNCFILITGYFMIDSCFKFKKLIKLWIEIFIYSVSITLIFYCLGISDFNIKYLVKSFLPITFNLYWFATTYVILYILTPFINVFINNVKKTTFLQLILLILTLWSIIPTFTNQEVGGTSVTWFITLYLIAAYIKKYPNTYCDKCLANILLAVIFYSLIIISVILFDIMGTKYSIFSNHATYLMGINKLPLVICSIALFLGFKNLKIEVNSFINSIAECMFGVYLIHDNSLVRTYIWLKLFKNNSFILSPYLLLHSIFAIITTFLICIFIDKLRIILLEKPIMKLINKKWFIIHDLIGFLKSKANQLMQN